MSGAPAALIVRRARLADIPAMVALIEAERHARQAVEPVFWRKAKTSAVTSTGWFSVQLASSKAVVLVAAEAGSIAGFLIAARTPAPPVYDPGGESWTVDDFAVGDTARWADVGRALWDAIAAHGRAAGWRQIICVSPVSDDSKAAMLRDAALHPVSQWWVSALDPAA